MAHRPLDAQRMREALRRLDERLEASARLVVGGGAAMVLAYNHPVATQDIDAFAAKGGLRIADLQVAARTIARQLDIEPDWLNTHFETFTGVLPSDYASRLRSVYKGRNLTVDALGPEDLLIMKCFANRDKDLPHARKLISLCAALDVVDRHLSDLQERRYPGAAAASDFFDDLRDELEG